MTQDEVRRLFDDIDDALRLAKGDVRDCGPSPDVSRTDVCTGIEIAKRKLGAVKRRWMESAKGGES